MPSVHEKASATSGTVLERRPPKMNALMGTPSGFSHSASMDGHCDAGTVNRELGWAALRPDCGVHGCPCQSSRCGGGASVMPSHHTSPSGVSATLVNIALPLTEAMQFGLVFTEVPGA